MSAIDRYVLLLWNRRPTVHFDAIHPYIENGEVHLVSSANEGPGGGFGFACAQAAHAVAHLVYSPPVFDGRGLGPIARALVALLEDARVEALACRELPGLRRRWLALHTAGPDDGDGIEALLPRISRALLDSGYRDEHPIVRKARRLLFADGAQQVMTISEPNALRAAATMLGNDIGQMRLQMNARMALPGPAYRDDSRWMWPAAASESPMDQHEQPADAGPRGSGPEADPDPEPDGATVAVYPEWDRLIGRYRRDWCVVREWQADDGVACTTDRRAPRIDPHPQRRAVRDALREAQRRVRARARPRLRRSGEADRFDSDAAIRAHVGWRSARRVDDTGLYLQRWPSPARDAVLILIDQSASTDAMSASPEGTVLGSACEAAALIADGYVAIGVPVAMLAFSSAGRKRVRMRVVKAFDEALDSRTLMRLSALRSEGSTRIGAAIRHAARRLIAVPATRRHVLIVGDAQPHDVDVHDRRYLPEDAVRALTEANGAGVGCGFLSIGLDPGTGHDLARRLRGLGRIEALTGVEGLPRALVRLLVRG